ncbi:uncharacterized protein LOC131538808 [Onychostoma macrolepis]|uniref:uncharacterized protein LOC131538808 n=1 Tax=Onychostoma macrolepis TaxID=369639 RepID=UPI00272A5E15|nr:uncharacterized protein LOC131538808 [Onychostoma macrolepis]
MMNAILICRQCKKSCGRKRKSIRTKSIFSHSHASLFSWMKYIHRFSQGLHMRQVDMMLDDISNSSATLSKMSMKLRSVCVRSMRRLREKRGQKVGGLNIRVHIDESKFRHRRKYARGRFGGAWRRKSWVFGMVEILPSRKPVLRLVDKRDKTTLLPIIEKHVKRGSIIHSDEWRAYSALSERGYQHHTVNHSINFVNPSTGVHTQNIERAWANFKREVWRLCANRSEKALKNHLIYIEWTYWLGRRHRRGILERLLHDISQFYN